uniref:Reverse transcriptase domain-containing protein n=1 Tax=Amphimedon queenslandica TaxID=400682 RepID=A0A1X7SKP0_AMPQE
DALSIRYKKPLLLTPINCDGCGSPFDLSHALSCRRGGLVTQRHNEVRDAIGDLAALAWGQVTKEPIVREGDNNTPALIADLAVRGVWTAQTEALFDVRVIDTDAQSYSCQTPPAVLTAAEKEKKRKYSAACEERRALFTPLCVSVDGLMGKECTKFIQRLADRLSLAWHRDYSTTINWIRTRLLFAIIRATILCLRGSRTKWRSVNISDGSPLDFIMS